MGMSVKPQETVAFENLFTDVAVRIALSVLNFIGGSFLLFSLLSDSFIDLDASSASVSTKYGLVPLSFFPLFLNSFLVLIISLTLSSLILSSSSVCISTCLLSVHIVKELLITKHTHVDQTLVILEFKETFYSKDIYINITGVFLGGS